MCVCSCVKRECMWGDTESWLIYYLLHSERDIWCMCVCDCACGDGADVLKSEV